MNIALLEKAKQSILSDPEFDMGDWDHCICGHVAKVNGVAALPSSVNAKALGIDDEQSRNLFFSNRWPTEYKPVMYGYDPVNACHLIDYFIKVDGRFQYTTNFTDMLTRVYPTPVPPPATPEPTPADIAAIDSLLANQEEEVCV